MIGRFLDPKNDRAFKRIFGREQNKDILLTMLNAVLGDQFHQPLEDLTFLPRNQDPEVAYAKESAVDVCCRDQDGCQYIIEMQVTKQDGFQQRAQYYAAKTFVNQAKIGHVYYNLKEVIFLAFVDFPLFPQKTQYKSKHVILDHETHERDLDLFSFTFVELKKFMGTFAASGRGVADLSLEEKFYYFLKEAEAMDAVCLKQLTSEEVFCKAFHEIERMNWSEAEFNDYESVLKAEWDALARLDTAKQDGIAEGRKEGEKEGIKIGKLRGLKEGRKDGIKKGIASIEKLVGRGVLTPAQGKEEIMALQEEH